MVIQETIEQKLTSAFQPLYLNVENESGMHNVAPGSESHFKVTVVATEFEGQRLLARHRRVNQVLADELANLIHALAIHTYTQQEWQERQASRPDSPACLGGGR